ncbi:MAG: plasmid pRiA4b ORF-3 family protein [Deltaproteobacteria bacterium]|nr:plasmid pRiA4b ORF-3 family protein [Deltaproteobacteria bacterium]
MKVKLKGLRPPIWRKFFVPSNITLDKLHHVIQKLMDWMDSHLHQFIIYDETYVDRTGPMDEGRDESKFSLDSFGFGKNSKFEYIYDFGDWWEHELTVLDADYQPEDPEKIAGCVGGKYACPPDDIGGPVGYAWTLGILADPKHPDYEDRKEFFEDLTGEDFDPEYFSAMEKDIRLRIMKFT